MLRPAATRLGCATGGPRAIPRFVPPPNSQHELAARTAVLRHPSRLFRVRLVQVVSNVSQLIHLAVPAESKDTLYCAPVPARRWCQGRRQIHRASTAMILNAVPARPGKLHWVAVPAGLDLQFLPPGRRDAARYLLNLLAPDDLEDALQPGEFRRLSSKILEKVMGSDYRVAVLQPLVARGIVERSPSYRPTGNGRKGLSKGYRLEQSLRSAGFERRVISDSEQVRRLTQFYKASQSLDEPVYRHLLGWHNRLGVRPGYDVGSKRLQEIADGGHYLKVCAQGRVHTNLTRLRRGDRCMVVLDGVREPLYAVDVRTSQPLLLGLSLQNYGALAGDRNFTRYCQERRERALSGGRGRLKEEAREQAEAYVPDYSDGLANDLERFVGHCLRGDLYEEFTSITKYSRDVTKRRFMATVFGRPDRAGVAKTGKAFVKLFPHLWAEALVPMNSAGNAGAQLACHLQTVESWLCIWRVCGRLARECPEAPLLTLHDCLVTSQSYVGRVRDVLEGEFRQVWGVPPSLKTEPFGRETPSTAPLRRRRRRARA